MYCGSTRIGKIKWFSRLRRRRFERRIADYSICRQRLPPGGSCRFANHHEAPIVHSLLILPGRWTVIKTQMVASLPGHSTLLAAARPEEGFRVISEALTVPEELGEPRR